MYRYLVAETSNPTILAGLSALSAAQSEIRKQLDVLKGRQQLYGALRDLAKARYDVALNFFRLKATVGLLSDEDITSLDRWLNVPAK